MSQPAAAPQPGPAAGPAPGTAPGPLVGSGRTADVYALPDGRVLRRYRDGGDTAAELALMRRLAAHGYPVPQVWPGPTARDLVMERLTGPTLAEAAATGAANAEAVGTILATLLHRLHTIPAVDPTDPAADPSADPSADPDERVLHMDFHPLNVMLTPRGPVVIDWANATVGPPALDRAMSALILAQAAVAMPEFASLARAVLPYFLRRIGPIHPGALARAHSVRAENPTLAQAEIDALGAAMALLAELAR